MRKIAGLIGLAGLMVLVGCRSTEYVPVPYPEYHTERKHDSIERWHYHTEYSAGDTVYVHDSVYLERLRDLWRHDSIEVPVPYPVHDTTYVQAPLTPWQKLQGRSWWWLATGLVVVVVWQNKKRFIRIFKRY